MCENIADETTCKATPLVSGECRDASGKDSQGECAKDDEGVLRQKETTFSPIGVEIPGCEKSVLDSRGVSLCTFYEPASATTCRWERDIVGWIKKLAGFLCRAIALSTCTDGRYKKRMSSCTLSASVSPELAGVDIKEMMDLDLIPKKPEDYWQNADGTIPKFGPWDETKKPKWLGLDNKIHSTPIINDKQIKVFWDNDEDREGLYRIEKGPWIYPKHGIGADICVSCSPGQAVRADRTTGNEWIAVYRPTTAADGNITWDSAAVPDAFKKTGDHCKTPRLNFGRAADLSCSHIKERCERCLPGKHTKQYRTTVSN